MNAPSPRYRFLNAAGRPLELHLTAETLILAPGGEAIRDEADADVPQVQALRRSGALVIRTVEPVEEKPPASRRRRSTTPRRRASTRRRRSSDGL